MLQMLRTHPFSLVAREDELLSSWDEAQEIMKQLDEFVQTENVLAAAWKRARDVAGKVKTVIINKSIAKYMSDQEKRITLSIANGEQIDWPEASIAARRHSPWAFAWHSSLLVLCIMVVGTPFFMHHS